MSILSKIFGTQNDRYLKKIYPLVGRINAFENDIKKLDDNRLSAKTIEFRERLVQGETLDDLLPEAFAVVREAAWRTLGQRHYDVQLIGAISLHEGKIAEMKTGEGKTLSSTPAVYLNALSGKGVNVVTVNDYLAKRDAEWMGPIYKFLGMSVGTILGDMDNEIRRENYAKDITYGTNNEFGFDYLRDNMVYDQRMKVQRDFNYCIVDEIDSVLIDEARTPLIISGAAENDIKKIQAARKIVGFFKEVEKNPNGRYPDEADPFNPQKPVGDYKIDEKSKNVTLTDDGMLKVESLLQQRNVIQGSLYNQENFEFVHYSLQALRAELMYHRDKDYMVKDNEVQIIDEHTGRVLSGRRYSDGLHQAIEAKENITIQRRSKTFASITFQNFFRMYKKLGGMTGTADTEASEFKNIYNLDVVVIPTNVVIKRADSSDKIYLTEREKLKAVVDDVIEAHKKGQPVLVGTITVEKSEHLSAILKKNNIRHNVLNAKNHAREAEIISEAGRVGAVTIATNMAGRGTDIKLGGDKKSDMIFEELMLTDDLTDNDRVVLLEIKDLVDKVRLDSAESKLDVLTKPARVGAEAMINSIYEWIEEHKEVKEVGGLYVLGTERHESRRIDNQLRGRSGRQGDPGKSTFYISLEDDLMRLFGGERIQGMLTRLGMEEGETIEHPWITGAIEKAQKKVEMRNFEMRKHLLEYDDVLNNQRNFIYSRRDEILKDNDIIDRVANTTIEIINDYADGYFKNLRHSAEDALAMLVKSIKEAFFIDVAYSIKDSLKSPDELKEALINIIKAELYEKDRLLGHEYLNYKLRELYLFLIDREWQNHLENMEQLREAVYLRAYSQKNPLVEYKIEGSNIFDLLIDNIRNKVVNQIFKIKIETVSAPSANSGYSTNHDAYSTFNNRGGVRGSVNKTPVVSNTISNSSKTGRNDMCPCGSGKKYKKCCGA
ncbi:MAG TPA: preprotein translocase subunit SecA [Spirochaetia bacterium]|nr:preprotein translocase subunit SecA [Spirochaetia bacterium]HBI37070.1 preprotein translocase subunit SecA [Spirochaetia bacterium]